MFKGDRKRNYEWLLIMAVCNLLYNSSEHQGSLRLIIKRALKQPASEQMKFIKNNLEQIRGIDKLFKVGVDVNSPESEVAASQREFYRDLRQILEELKSNGRIDSKFEEEVSKAIGDLLNTATPGVITALNEVDQEIKTLPEELDLNLTRLDQHLSAFYGPEQLDIRRSLVREFSDMVTAAAYYDRSTNTVVSPENSVLNTNIRTMKSGLFKQLVEYLKTAEGTKENTSVQSLSENLYDKFGHLDISNYLRATRLFYALVVRPDKTWTKTLQAEHSRKIQGQSQVTEEKKAAFAKLVKEVNALMGGDGLTKALTSRFGEEEAVKAGDNLYSGDSFSPLYAEVLKYIQKGVYTETITETKDGVTQTVEKRRKLEDHPEVQKLLKTIQQEDGLLTAAKSYTMLTQFDRMLTEYYGKQVNVSTDMGIETDNTTKYKHHQDTSHERKDWQTSEAIGSERHTARFTKALLDSIEIVNFKTQEWMGKRVDSTALIVAARNLFNAVLYNKVNFLTEDDTDFLKLKDAMIVFRDNPTPDLKTIFDILFEKKLIDKLAGNNVISDYDLSVLYSIHQILFSSKNKNSLYKQSLDLNTGEGKTARAIIEEISGYVNRNSTIEYMETVYDYETGAITTRAKKKFFNQAQLHKLTVQMNTHINNMAIDERRRIQDKYNLTLTEKDKKTQYTVTINGSKVTISVPNTFRVGILGRNKQSGRNSQITISADAGFLPSLNDVNLERFLQNDGIPRASSKAEQNLAAVLEFLSDVLGMQFTGDNKKIALAILNTYSQIYRSTQGFDHFMEPLLQLAIRSAYVNKQYLAAETEGKELREYLESTNDSAYSYYTIYPGSNFFTSRLTKIAYRPVSYTDSVLGIWTDAVSIFNGETSKATTKDKQQNSIPNNSVAKLGSDIHYVVGKQVNTNMSSLLFAREPGLITGTYHDLEVTNMQNTSKSVKAFSRPELFYHAIFNKFYGKYLSDSEGSVAIQPTTNSDKTTFINYAVKTALDGVNLMTVSQTELEIRILKAFEDSVGIAAVASWQNTTDKLQAIANQYRLERNLSVEAYPDYRDVLHEMEYADFLRIARDLNLEVEENQDYRIVKNNGREVIGVNGLLQYQAELYQSRNLKTKLDTEKRNFLDMLIKSHCTYQVLEGTDSLEMFTEDELPKFWQSKNPIMTTILDFFEQTNNNAGRREFFETWVDAKTGKLILAKQDGKNIISVSDNWDNKKNVELNPFLNRFFYIESLYSTNLKTSLTGFATNHKSDTKKSPLTLVSKYTKDEWNNKVALEYGVLEDADYEMLHNAEGTGLLDNVIDNDDVSRKLQARKENLSKTVIDAVTKLVENTHNYELCTAESTQLKRHVIIPATLQYVTKNHFEGPASKIRCAVIDDAKAHVFNYRGENGRNTEDVDANDGLAKITPFQAIMENRALGSQAVGFTKKPIWHSYDASSGTAFLAKFATNTITNETMMASLRSEASDFRLFKKATNIQWGSEVDLTTTLSRGQSFETDEVAEDEGAALQRRRSFRTVMLGSNDAQLFYQDKYGTTKEIIGFNKGIYHNGQADQQAVYYTEERLPGSTEISKVYHVFVDEMMPDGTVNKSVHKTFNSLIAAATFMNETKAANAETNLSVHTINSLFELHSALGGIHCVDSNGNISEFNNEVVVNFMNNVGTWKEDYHNGSAHPDQTTVNQPLKDYHIGYLFNKTSVKNGAKNINPATAWNDDSDLATFLVDIAGLGMQMNADHDVINSELTEFSQVIAATAAYGYTFDNTYEIFQGLAKTAFEASSGILTAVDSFLDSIVQANAGTDQNGKPLEPEKIEAIRTEAKAKLYDVVGRMMFVNRTASFRVKPTDMLMREIQSIFNKYSKHDSPDELRIPFSDPNVYSDFINTIANTITKTSIKRKHPGSGFVLVGSYDMIQYFEVPDPKTGKTEKLFTPAILQRARNEYKEDLLYRLRSLETVNQFQLNALRKIKGINIKIVDKPWRSDPTKSNKTLRISDSEHPDWGYFELVKDTEFGYYSVHFKTGDKTTGVTYSRQVRDADGNVVETLDTDEAGKESRKKLYQALLAAIPDGAYVSTYGEVSKGGIKALKNLATLGNMTKVDTRTVKNLKDMDMEIPIYRKGDIVMDPYRTMSLAQLEAKAKKKLAAMPEYYLDSDDTYAVDDHLLRSYLLKQQAKCPIQVDRNYFSPADNVRILNADGTELARVNFKNDLGKYYQFTSGFLPDGTQIPADAKYQLDVLTPSNLKPSLIRWKSIDPDDGKEHYHNIFELPTIKNAYLQKLDTNTKSHRTAVQDILHNLHDGFYKDEQGREISIIEGSLENEAAEVVLSNMYKDLFGIGNEQLSEILREGEAYFIKQQKNLHAPYYQGYEMAFMKQNGDHTLITLDQVKVDDYTQPNQFTNITTNEYDEIYAVKGNKPFLKIGRWVTVSNVVLNPTTKKYEGEGVTGDNQHLFRVKDGKVQKRIDFVTRYQVSIQAKDKNGTAGFKQYTLYKIADVDTIESALRFNEGTKPEDRTKDATNQQARLVQNLYLSDNYQFAQLNTSVDLTKRISDLRNATQMLRSKDNPIDPEVRRLLNQQFEHPTDRTRKAYEQFEEAKRKFLRAQAHKQYISFLDSLNVISSRIPAQTLQSFMAMKTVGWTSNSKNMAYVSVFQTYLQGSDYDIDKAYIMGQSYDDNAVYIGWSPYFDFTSLGTLTESKKLPIPKGARVKFDLESNVDITAEIANVFKHFDAKTLEENKDKITYLDPSHLPEAEKKGFLRDLRTLLLKVERAGVMESGKLVSKVKWDSSISADQVAMIQATINRHEGYQIPANVAERAYKNLASANIFMVSHDIRNRDQAYTAITMADAQAVADNSPKGKASSTLSMLNPLAKYEMQYQNIVGKQVVGIAANGEKYWFNTFYYWHHVMETGSREDKEYLRFNVNLSRVRGRAQGSREVIKDGKTRLEIICEEHGVIIPPDINTRSEAIRESLREVFGMSDDAIDSLEYKYADQTISQLLSAATDNAKALILAKINAGTNYAKMYLYLVTLGYNLDDIAAFMYSPISEFIDSRSSENMFDPQQLGKPANAIKAARGLVSSWQFLHGFITFDTVTDEEVDDESSGPRRLAKNSAVKGNLLEILESEGNEILMSRVRTRLDLQEGMDIADVKLDQLMQAIILEVVDDPKAGGNEEFNFTDYSFTEDMEISSYIRYCQDLVAQLRDVKKKYEKESSTPLADLLADAKEFDKIYNLSSEASTIAAAWLGLNQGIPQTKIEQLKRLASMARVVTDREKYLEIRDYELFPTDDSEEVKLASEQAWASLIAKVKESNPTLEESRIKQIVEDAHANGIINKFNVLEMMKNAKYRQVAKDYVHLIKGTYNIIDMMDKLPHYKAIMDCFRAVLVADDALVVKSKMLSELLASEQFVNQDSIDNVVRYVDELTIVEFLESADVPIINLHKDTASGFKASFDSATEAEPVSSFDLSSPEGVAGFLKWANTDFLAYLNKNYSSNPLVSHLVLYTQDGRAVIAPDIDLLNPDISTASRIAFDQMLVGMTQFETEPYAPEVNGNNLTIADILQLYNLIVNRNRTGGERLTSLFQVCNNPNGIMHKYYRFIGNMDHEGRIPDYSRTDFLISAAPTIAPALERFHTEPYIKVKDPVWGTRLRKYNQLTNSYEDYEILPNFMDNADQETKTKRKINFMEYYPFEMPNRFVYQAFSWKGQPDQVVAKNLANALLNLTRSGKIILAKIC